MNVFTPLLYYGSFFFITWAGEIIPAGILFVLVELFGIFLICWSSLYLGIRIFPIQKKQLTLIISGPYAYVRHPMYLGLLLVSASLVFDNPIIWGLIIFGVHIVSLHLLIEHEEHVLEKKYKSKFIKYTKKTKKLIPFLY